jgi:hypothetical protein
LNTNNDALVIGSAECLAADLDQLGQWDGLRIGVNHAAYYVENLDAIATLHPEFVEEWAAKREAAGFQPVPFYTHNPQGGAIGWQPENLNMWSGGSSALFAGGVARYVLGAKRVVFAGVPLEDGPNPWRNGYWKYSKYRVQWVKAKRKGYTDGWEALSGWTKDFLAE